MKHHSLFWTRPIHPWCNTLQVLERWRNIEVVSICEMNTLLAMNTFLCYCSPEAVIKRCSLKPAVLYVWSRSWQKTSAGETISPSGTSIGLQSEISLSRNVQHAETSQMIYRANQLTGFYITQASNNRYFQSDNYWHYKFT